MIKPNRVRQSLLATVAFAGTFAVSGPAFAQGTGSQAAETRRGILEEVIVTAQRRQENLQSVPIAVSAFNAQSLEMKKIEGGASLQQSIPNASFSRGNFGGYNFQIRGIGTKLVSSSGDQATSIHINNSPVTINNLQDVDFYDVSRVEVLRGPQGTLYGRNATGGVINVLTAKPDGEMAASLTGEAGSFGTWRAKGMANLPLAGDTFGLRAAGTYVKREGFGTNTVLKNKIDGRDLYDVRGTVGFKPADNFRADLMISHFKEDDNKSRIGKQLCAKDPTPASVGGVAVIPGSLSQGFLSQGCVPASLYSPASLGTVDSRATLGGLLGNLTGLITGDANAGNVQNPDLRAIQTAYDPIYRSKQTYVHLNMEWKITDQLEVVSITGHNETDTLSVQDYNRITPTRTFNVTPLSPGGVFIDPQVGASNVFRTFDKGDGKSTEWAQELHLSSNFDGPVNFTVGGIYIKLHNKTNYYVFGNTLTAYAMVLNGGRPCPNGVGCVYIDPKPATEIDGTGHNYYDNRSDYRLDSKAVFGELYYQANDDLKLTGGLRYTQDKKSVITFNVPLLAPGIGLTPNPEQTAKFSEMTGKIGFDWKPRFSFTDDSLIYGTYSRGYKGGGFNPPGSVGVAGVAATFAPEFVDAFEVGSKNAFNGGSLILNLTGFYYKYSGYQVSKIVNRTSVNENLDAKIKGLELESLWTPIDNLQFNFSGGLLDTEITKGSSIDTFNRTQGDPNLTLVKAANASNCVAPTAGVANVLRLVNAGVLGPTTLLGICDGALRALGAIPSEGVAVNLVGKQLPNAPKWNLSMGLQYTLDLDSDWQAIGRVDYFKQGSSFTRIYNSAADTLQSWDNTNMSVRFVNPNWGFTGEVYVTNVFDDTPITDAYLTDDSSGLFRNIFLLDPRVVGVKLTKKF